MKDFLNDFIQYTHGIGVIELIKVSGTTKETQISSVTEDKSVLITGTLKTPHPEFVGTFGMPNLDKLKTILSFEDYEKDSIINAVKETRDNVESLTTIHFESKNKTFVNDYRLMSKAIVEDKIPTFAFKGTTWDVEFEPSIVGIQRFKRQASALSDTPHFIAKTDNGDLRFYFGDPSTHSGNCVFHNGVQGTLSKQWKYPIKAFQAIMDIPGDKVFRFSERGAAEITIDSGLANYSYLFPAQTK